MIALEFSTVKPFSRSKYLKKYLCINLFVAAILNFIQFAVKFYLLIFENCPKIVSKLSAYPITYFDAYKKGKLQLHNSFSWKKCVSVKRCSVRAFGL